MLFPFKLMIAKSCAPVTMERIFAAVARHSNSFSKLRCAGSCGSHTSCEACQEFFVDIKNLLNSAHGTKKKTIAATLFQHPAEWQELLEMTGKDHLGSNEEKGINTRKKRARGESVQDDECKSEGCQRLAKMRWHGCCSYSCAITAGAVTDLEIKADEGICFVETCWKKQKTQMVRLLLLLLRSISRIAQPTG